MEDLVAVLDATFANLRRFGVKLNPEKCTFGVLKGKLLGYIVSERGIEANLDKITTITNMGPICNVHLSRRIPTGRQLDTLNADNPSTMYIGNSGLCGPPLEKNCPGNNTFIQNNQRSNMQEHYPMSFYLGLILGFVAGLWVVFCVLLFKKTWRISFFWFIDNICDKVYVFVVLSWASLSRSSAAK